VATAILKTTGETLKKSAQAKAVTKAAKGTGKTVTKTVKASAAVKAVTKALEKTSERTRNGFLVAAGAITAAGAYLFGPGDSHGRRARLAARFKHGRDAGDLNDPALARKVETEIFRPEDAPKGDVVVNVEYGVVFLRGTVPEDKIAHLESAARGVDGVRDVENLLQAR
jgi:osmotically-inducible protein OsmY